MIFVRNSSANGSTKAKMEKFKHYIIYDALTIMVFKWSKMSQCSKKKNEYDKPTYNNHSLLK